LPEGDEPRQKDIVKMPGLQGKNYGKTTTRYADYKQLDSGLQYKDVKVGTGPTPQDGDRVVYDW
jgi:FKBP-type peptidyl-prolyl cis-trans isomerase